MIRIVIACPEAHIGDANNLAMVLGMGPADGLTYGAPGWQDGAGNLYAVASLPVSPEWLVAAQTGLERPAWDTEPYAVNMAGAERAQARVVLHSPAGEGDDPTPVPQANPDTILALPGDPLAMLAAAGLTRIAEEIEDA